MFGNGGYIPGEDKPVLTPIEFTVTVDDFEAVAAKYVKNGDRELIYYRFINV